MNANKEAELLQIVEKILNLDSAMRFAAITDLNGKILEGIMKENKSSLESQKQQEKFCKDAAKARKMREVYDSTLGKVRYVHTERENVTQIHSYTQNCTIFITMEPELSITKKLQIITKIKKITSHLWCVHKPINHNPFNYYNMSKKSLKILVDEMDDGMDEKLKEIGFDAYSVKKLRADGLKLHADYSLIKYAKENNMILITRDKENGIACKENAIPCILLDREEIFKIVLNKLNQFWFICGMLLLSFSI